MSICVGVLSAVWNLNAAVSMGMLIWPGLWGRSGQMMVPASMNVGVGGGGRSVVVVAGRPGGVARTGNSRWPGELSVAVSGLSVCLGVFLIVAGKELLDGAARAEWMHRAYVRVKVVLTLAAGFVMVSLLMSVNYGSRVGIAVVVAQAMRSVGAGLIYPAVIVVVMRTRGWRDYFQGLGGDGAL